MKSNNNFKSMSFGFSTVNAGQRNVTVEPQVIAVSTEGSFRITPPVSRALGVGHGEYVMFLSNVDNINVAIAQNAPEVVEFCETNGLELGSVEAAIAIHKEFDMWAIAKGIEEFDTKGNMKTTTERLTKNDKITFVSQNFDEMMAAAMENASDEVKEALSREGVTKEEQMDLLVGFVNARKLPKFKGSKVANPAGTTGAGVPLTFTDTNVWKQLKADMGDDDVKMNREFDVDIENLQDIQISNGYEEVTVKAIVLGDYTDKQPNHVGRKKDVTNE